MGISLLRQAGLGIRKVQIQGENLKALQAKFDERGEVAGSSYYKIMFQSLIKINKRHCLPHIDCTIVQWRVKLLKCYISETKENSFVEATAACRESL